LLGVFSLLSIANDGAYKGSGSNLIPISDSSISVEKEILKITRIDGNAVEVDVYYEFYNEGESKEMLIGFEAMSPSGDVGTLPINGQHPYITDFSVIVNGESILYQVAKVRDSTYFVNGVFNEIASEDYELSDNLGYVDFFYVYHFNCKLNSGLNIIKHSYRHELSSSVMEEYSFDYVLSAANRWKRGVISDFKLVLDFGEFQEFNISRSFFETKENWKCSKGFHRFKLFEDSLPEYMSPHMNCIVEKGPIVFNKLDFEPNGELRVVSYPYYYFHGDSFDFRKDEIGYGVEMMRYTMPPKDEKSKKILKNIPFAIRGYIFKSKDIQEYYKRQDWYSPNSDYKATLESLSKAEQALVLKWSD
jgi:hypothetical protein